MRTILSAASSLSASACVLLAANAAPASAQSSWPELRAGFQEGSSELGPQGPFQLSGRPSCEPDWVPTFAETAGLKGEVHALAVFDDGSGPALYVGGRFEVAGDQVANSIARWNGSSWSTLGSGMSDTFLPTVHALVVFDDGSGPALYAGGSFTSAGGQSASCIAKWDGSTWSALGSGIEGGPGNPVVMALAVYDDGSGPALYAGGRFSTAGGQAASRIAKWDGSAWSTLGSGIGGGTDATVHALAAHDDGSGPALYVGGNITEAGGQFARGIAKWAGGSWSAVGATILNHYGSVSVESLAVHDDGTGPALYMGGQFTQVGNQAARSIAKWNGNVWSNLGGGLIGSGTTSVTVSALVVFDDGSGPALYAGGTFSSTGRSIAKWHGGVWTPLGIGMVNGTNGAVHALAVFDDGSGPALHVGGEFSLAADQEADNIAKWDGSSWSILGSGVFDPHLPTVRAFAVFDDGSGPALYVGGRFEVVGGQVANSIARWDGSSWSTLGSGIGGGNATVYALAVYDDGSGPALYAGGSFTSAGGQAATSFIAKWDGSSWSALGEGLNGQVSCLAVFDDGSGPALYVGGGFLVVGDPFLRGIAKWNGSAWSSPGVINGGPNALAVFDDGSGPALYVAGSSMIVNNQFYYIHIARWDGDTWSEVGGGMSTVYQSASVESLAVHDDGTGPALFAGGKFTHAGGQLAVRIAKWDGSSWSGLGSGIMGGPTPRVSALTGFDDGSGPALFAAGQFTLAGDQPANGIAKWDGNAWSALDSGTNDAVHALAVFDDGSGPLLYVGGDLTEAGGQPAHHLATWGCGPPAALGTAFCSGDGSGSACPCGNSGDAGHGCANSAPGSPGGILSATGSGSLSGGGSVLRAADLVPNQFCLFFQGTAELNGGLGAPLGDGLLCVAGQVIRLEAVPVDSLGRAATTLDLAAAGNLSPGDLRLYQCWYRNTSQSPCGTASNLTNALEILWLP